MADREFLGFAEGVMAAARRDAVRLSAVSPELSAEKLAEIEKNIAQAHQIPTDEKLRAFMAEKSAWVRRATKAAHLAYRQIEIYILRSVAQQKIHIESYLINQYNAVKNQKSQLHEYLTGIKNTAKQYRAQLVAVGCGENVIETLSEAVFELGEAIQAQQKAKQERSTAAKSRIKHYNGLFEDIRPIVETAKFVFFRDAVKIKPYLAYQKTIAKPEISVEAVETGFEELRSDKRTKREFVFAPKKAIGIKRKSFPKPQKPFWVREKEPRIRGTDPGRAAV